jgi:hypothetical protein
MTIRTPREELHWFQSHQDQIGEFTSADIMVAVYALCQEREDAIMQISGLVTTISTFLSDPSDANRAEIQRCTQGAVMWMLLGAGDSWNDELRPQIEAVESERSE